MKIFIYSILLVFAFMNFSFAEPAIKKFTIKKGTNISHWLSQSKRRGKERLKWFTKQDVEFLATIGFDHIRIPIDEEQMWNEEGNMEREAFELLNRALDWCADYNLVAIVDLHILRSHHFNAKDKPLWTDPEAQTRFFQCWLDLSSQLKNRPLDKVAYELMNEPVAENAQDWNILVAKTLAIVRESEPNRVIFIGSNRWQSASTFDQLKVPQNDPNIYLSFHMYEPFALTHHKASWSSIKDYDGPVQYPGITVKKEDFVNFEEDVQKVMERHVRHFNKDSIAVLIQKPLALAKETGLPLYCGEWGCLPTVPEKDRLQWYKDVRSVFEKNGIAWTTWDYKGGFGIMNNEGIPQKKLIDVLVK